MGSLADPNHATCNQIVRCEEYQAKAAYSYMPVFPSQLWVQADVLREMQFAYWLKHR
jgi:hypothetical protein